MKKGLIIMIFSVFTFFLYACDKKETKLTDEDIRGEIQNLLDAKSYETSLHIRLVTEELEVKFNPLLTIQKYTDDEDKNLIRMYYYNKIMEAIGLEGFEVIVDEESELIYINDTDVWYKGTYGEAINFDEDFSLILNNINDDNSDDLKIVQDIIFNAIKNFKKATFIEGLKENDRNLVHYELEYNVYDVMKEIFDYFNQDKKLEYEDFESFIEDIKFEDIANLFKTFIIDIYFDIDQKNDIARIELDFMNIMNNDIIIDKIQEEVDDAEIDVKKMFDYVEDFEIGIKINKINSMPEIIIPEEAKNGYELKYIFAPFEPDELTAINLGTPFVVTIDENIFERWYTFTLAQSSYINIYSSHYGPDMMILDSNFNNIYTLNYPLSAGTYYLGVASEISGDYTITVSKS